MEREEAEGRNKRDRVEWENRLNERQREMDMLKQEQDRHKQQATQGQWEIYVNTLTRAGTLPT